MRQYRHPDDRADLSLAFGFGETGAGSGDEPHSQGPAGRQPRVLNGRWSPGAASE